MKEKYTPIDIYILDLGTLIEASLLNNKLIPKRIATTEERVMRLIDLVDVPKYKKESEYTKNGNRAKKTYVR